MAAVIDAASVSAFIAGILALSTPMAFAALGEVISERAGIINLGTEGVMLVGVRVGVPVSVRVGVCVGVSVIVGVGVRVAVSVGVGVDVAVAVSVGVVVAGTKGQQTSPPTHDGAFPRVASCPLPL